MRTTSCPGPGCGSGTSRSNSFSGPPNSETTMAFMSTVLFQCDHRETFASLVLVFEKPPDSKDAKLQAGHRKTSRRLPLFLLRLPQIGISLVEPVLTRRIENVEVNCIFERFSFVRHVGRNAQHFAGMHHDFFAVDPELQRAL